MISNELLEEVIYVSNKNKYLSKKLIEKIIEYAVEQKDDFTRKKFNGIFFETNSFNGKAVCTCEISLGNIRIDYNKLIKEYKKSKTLSFLMINLDMISEFFHEIGHLEEDSKISLLNLESLLISYSSVEIFENLALDKLKLIKNFLNEMLYNDKLEQLKEKIYLKIYEKIPSERFVSINASKELFNSICNYDNFDTKYQDAFEFVNKNYLSKYYMGYEKILKNMDCFNSPLLDYLSFIKMPNLLQNYDFFTSDIKKFLENTSKSFSIEERMFYGFPVTLKDTDELDKKLILTK